MVEAEESHLFDSSLRKYEDKLVEFVLDIAQQKRVTRKLSTISSYLFIHEELTQKELKELTGFSMGTISTFLSVLTGAGNFIGKRRVEGTHTFVYSFPGNLETLTVKGVEVAISSIISLESFLKGTLLKLKKLDEQGKKGAKHLSQRIVELLDSFEYYKEFFPDILKLQEEIIQKRPIFQKKATEEEVKELEFDQDVYLIEDIIHNQLAASQMFSTRDPLFIRILGLFMTRKYLTQKTLKDITGLSSGKISQEVNQFLEDGLIEKAEVTDKGKITYSANSAGLILLRFSRSILSRFMKWGTLLEEMKLDLENNENTLGNLKGYDQIYRMIIFVTKTVLAYKKSISIMDKVLNDSKQP